jgi:hypothetical protein
MLRLLLLLTLPLAIGCDAVSPDEAPVRFVHAAPGAPSVSFFLGDIGEDEVAFGQTVPYQFVETGDQTARVRAALDAERRYLDQIVRVERGRPATFVLLDTLATQPYVYLSDDTLSTDRRQVRLVHGAQGIGPLDVYEADASGAALGSRPIVQAMAFRGNTGFVGLGQGIDGLVAVSPLNPEVRFFAAPLSPERATFVIVAQGAELAAVELDERPPPEE